MSVPFADLFKKAKARFVTSKTAAARPMPVAIGKPDGEKFAKTVLPNAVRTFATEQGSGQAPNSVPKLVSLGHTAKAGDLPPAVALALEPRVERVLSLALSDIIEKVPEGYLKPRASVDTTRRVLLKASEVEKGMAARCPSVGVSSVYQQMPEIFMRVVAASDTTAVPLPFEKVLDQLSRLSTRIDQTNQEVTPQFETPFLQVTMEESKKFGTSMAPVTIAEMPSVPRGMEVATAETIAAAEPDVASRDKFVASPVESTGILPAETAGVTGAARPTRETAGATPTPPTATTPVLPTRIPFSLVPHAQRDSASAVSAPADLSGIGTGEPAFPRVPASGGPPVPQAPLAPAAPTRIPFKLTVARGESAAPGERSATAAETARAELKNLAAQTGGLPAGSAQAPPERAAAGAPMVTLPLRPILQTLPPIQSNGDAASVPADANISFPFPVIAPQLPTGKVVIAPRDFHAALPPEYRDSFLPDAVNAPVALSLPDVLANLPGNALDMRADQEIHKSDEVFETPFSLKAAEDAERFRQIAEPPKVDEARTERAVVHGREEPERLELAGISMPREVAVLAPVSIVRREKDEIPRAHDVIAEEQAASEDPGHLPTRQAATEPKLDAKAAVAKASVLSGVGSCGITFSDGLTIAGNIPQQLQVDGLTAVAPTLLQKLEKHMLETQLGTLTCLTVHGDKKTPVTFFSAGNICLTAVHNAAELTPETRRELASITQTLSRTYAQPETTHVDH